MAIARARTSAGISPPEAVDVLLEMAEHWNTQAEGGEAGCALAALLDALGCLHPSSSVGPLLSACFACLSVYLRA